MKNLQSILLWAIGASMLALFACNDPTVIGSDLLSGDELDIEFTDTVTILTYNMEEDSVRMFDSENFSVSYNNIPVGEFIDPVFGISKATAYAQPNLNVSSPDFEDAELDSIVLILPWNADGVYGNLFETYSLEIWELSDDLRDSAIFYSNQTFEVNEMIGSVDFTPEPEDSVRIKLHGQDTLIEVIPQVRVTLTPEFGDRFFVDDTLKFGSTDLFHDFFKGFEIRPASQNSGMLNFNLRSPEAGIRVYYRQDTTYSQYLFPIFSTNVVTAKYEHDYAGSLASPFIGEDANVTDSLLFVQGMSGLNLAVEIPYADRLEDIVVNQAELVFPVLRLSEDDPLNTAVEQLIVSEMVDDTTLVVIDDIIFSGANFPDIFGGQVEAGDVYKMNISSYFQDMMRGLKSNKIVITVFLKPENASRVVLAGPGHADSPAKLNLTFTRY